MTRKERLSCFHSLSGLSELFHKDCFDEPTHAKWVSICFHKHYTKIRKIELHNNGSKPDYFRIYYFAKINENRKNEINSIPGLFRSESRYSDFQDCDFMEVCKSLYSIITRGWS